MIVYLHGLNSAGTSAKAVWLREHLPDITVFSPTYPVHLASTAPRFLSAYLAEARRRYSQDQRLLLVGSSMGGFWARYLAPELGAGMALINPAMHPETDLLSAVGPNRNLATGEEYFLSEERVRALGRYQVAGCDSSVPTLVLLDEADELLDYRVAQAFYAQCGKVIVYPGGSHRFDHLREAVPEIRRLHDSLRGGTSG